MIYVDTSVVLARLLLEDRAPPDEFWSHSLFSSRLLEYEVWVRLRAARMTTDREEDARLILQRVSMIELSTDALARALDPFPAPVRTLDALHLASADFLRRQQPSLPLATYDERMAAAARALDFQILSP